LTDTAPFLLPDEPPVEEAPAPLLVPLAPPLEPVVPLAPVVVVPFEVELPVETERPCTLILLQVAAWLAAVLSCVYGRKKMEPVSVN